MNQQMADRLIFEENARTRLSEVTVSIDKIRTALKSHQVHGELAGEDHLEKCETQMYVYLAAVEKLLQELRDVDSSAWNATKDEMENAWEELTVAVRSMISRLS